MRKARKRKLKKDADGNQGEKRGKRLEKYGKQRRWSNDAKQEKLINNLNLRVKMFSNENQQLKRQMKRQMKRQLSSTLNEFGELEESPDQSSLSLAVTSATAKRQATKQLSVQKLPNRL